MKKRKWLWIVGIATMGVILICLYFVWTPFISTETVIATEEASQTTSTLAPNVSTSILQCDTYIETTWGTEVGQLGLCPTSAEQMGHPYSPVLNSRGDLFILDQVNQRILRYSDNTLTRTVKIPSSYILNDPCSYSTRGLSNLGTYRDRIFLRFPIFHDERLVEHIAILSSTGQEEQVISLEAYHPRYPPSSPIADTEEGFYLLSPTLSVLYFDANFRPEFMGIEADELLGSRGLVVGWDANIYTYSANRDLLINWGNDNSRIRQGGESVGQIKGIISATQTTSLVWTLFLGTDAYGEIYFGIREKGAAGYRVARISASGDQLVVATVPDGILDDGVSPTFSLAPDGSLYSMSYGSEDPNPELNPRIVKCIFGN